MNLTTFNLNNHLEHLDLIKVLTGSLGIWECTEGFMADLHRLVSHPWIYTQLLNWSSSLKSQIEGLTEIIIIIKQDTSIKWLIISSLFRTIWSVYKVSPLWNLKYQERKKKFADDTDYNLEERERLLYDQVCLCYLQGGQNARIVRIFSLEIHFFLFFWLISANFAWKFSKKSRLNEVSLT